jgi:hypothetical protein
MLHKIIYTFSAELWQHPSPGGWYFVSLPENLASEIRSHLSWQEEGWGRMKATASLNSLEWETAIWFDRKAGTYLLPIKAEIRKQAGLQSGKMLSLQLAI